MPRPCTRLLRSRSFMTDVFNERPDVCETCPLEPNRREFFQQARGIALGVLLGLGVSGRLAASMRPTVVTAHRLAGGKPAYPIPAQDGVQIDRDNAVILVRWQNALYAFNL